MGWANLSISSELSRIKYAIEDISKKDKKLSDALRDIVTALERIEKAMDDLAHKVRR